MNAADRIVIYMFNWRSNHYNRFRTVQVMIDDGYYHDTRPFFHTLSPLISNALSEVSSQRTMRGWVRLKIPSVSRELHLPSALIADPIMKKWESATEWMA
jgi:hypothetical protein